MALTYAQLDALTTSTTFLARVRSAVASHAHYWRDNVAHTSAQLQWVAQVFGQSRCAQIAANMARELVWDAVISGSSTGDGSDVTDLALQGAVDVICEKYT